MAPNYIPPNGELGSSTNATSETHYYNMPESIDLEQSTWAVPMANARFDGQAPNRSFCPANSGQNIYSNHLPTMNASYLNRNQNLANVEQPIFTSPFSASLGFNDPRSNLQGHQPLTANLSQGYSSYATQQHGQGSFNGYMNPGYANFGGGSFQPAIPSTPFGVTPIPTNASPTSAKPYPCSFGCGQFFARKGDMERHARTHGPPTLWCDVDGCTRQKGFHRKDKLRDHRKTHESH